MHDELKRVLAAVGVAGFLAMGCDAAEPQRPTTAPAADAPAARVAGEPSASPAAPTPADARPAMIGVVTDGAGQPLEGAIVFADATLFYNTNLEARSGADGTYRIELPPDGMHTTWRGHASLRREYHGQMYRFDLHPDDDAPFAGRDGATRNFQWRLSGKRPDGQGTYGGRVVAYAELMSDIVIEDVELSLTPDGPLVDGSAGEPIRARVENTPDGWCLPDVPVGRYRITAALAAKGQEPAPLKVRVRNGEEYADAVVADFASPYGANLPIHRIELEVKRP